MLISEIYHSLQGEGLLTGTPSVFLRTSGCNLRCWFCDTPFASWEPEGQKMSLDEIVQTVVLEAEKEGSKHIVLTGGEPMFQKKVVELTRLLAECDFHITIETAGTIFAEVSCDLMSISPKLSNSTPSIERAGEWANRHEAKRHQPDVIAKLLTQFEYQLKFVVDTPDDLNEIEAYLSELPSFSTDRVLLMPQGTELAELKQRENWLRSFCDKAGYRFCERKHIEWYGNKRGT